MTAILLLVCMMVTMVPSSVRAAESMPAEAEVLSETVETPKAADEQNPAADMNESLGGGYFF